MQCILGYLYSDYKSNNCIKLIFKPSSCHELINDSKQAVIYCGPDSSLNKVQRLGETLNLPANKKEIEQREEN